MTSAVLFPIHRRLAVREVLGTLGPVGRSVLWTVRLAIDVLDCGIVEVVKDRMGVLS